MLFVIEKDFMAISQLMREIKKNLFFVVSLHFDIAYERKSQQHMLLRTICN
jgi:hypothetical protein